MPFTKGQSGHPGGRAAEKVVSDALRLAAFADSKEKDENGVKKRKIRVMAEKIVNQAVCGDLDAFKVIADRLDGRPSQDTNLFIDDKRDSDDWTRAALVDVIKSSVASNGSNGAGPTNGRGGKPDKVH